ncbi:MAG: GNAT family N-acetyltransferase [Rhodospirillaceae bacterium]|nr:GNAT family N-acetyltransferase [Rhodospirillaceae bacterium]
MFRVVHFGPDDTRMADARRIRTEVFCGEQQVPPHLEWDGQDAVCDHFLIFDGDAAIGVARLRSYRGMAKIERVAVLAAHRGRDAGWDLMEAVLARAKARGFVKAMLNAQVAVEAFYAAMGFVSEGDRFMEADIEHVRMTRAL